jgi:hypothetical protein
MLKQKPRKEETLEQWKAFEAYFPINPPKFDLDETTMTNIQWREHNKHKEVWSLNSFFEARKIDLKFAKYFEKFILTFAAQLHGIYRRIRVLHTIYHVPKMLG